jgi:hypothetical protein
MFRYYIAIFREYLFFYKILFARCKYTHFRTGQYEIVPGQPIYLQNTRYARGHGTTSSGDGRYSSEKWAQKKKTLHQKGKRSEENVFGSWSIPSPF